MRDDIHKEVSRPRSTQAWVKCALREADAASGRSLRALLLALEDDFKREVSVPFLNGIHRQLEGLPGILGDLDSMKSPLELGGDGGPLEQEWFAEARLSARDGRTQEDAYQLGLERALKERVDCNIRAAKPVLLGSDDPDSLRGIRQLAEDARNVDFKVLAERLLHSGANLRALRNLDRVKPDDNLLGSNGKAAKK